jgi:integrase
VSTTSERRFDHHAGLRLEKRGSHQNALGAHQLGERFLLQLQGKTRKARRLVPLSERVIALLRNIQLEQMGQREGWVFPSKKSTSGYIGLSGIEHTFRELARKLGIPDALKLYCARHTFGTVAMAETRNPGLVKEVMGHESLDTTMGYLHPETSQIKVVIDRLNQQKHVM